MSRYDFNCFPMYLFQTLQICPFMGTAKVTNCLLEVAFKSRQNMYGETFPLDAYFRVTDCFFINLQKIDRLTSCNKVFFDPSAAALILVINL